MPPARPAGSVFGTHLGREREVHGVSSPGLGLLEVADRRELF